MNCQNAFASPSAVAILSHSSFLPAQTPALDDDGKQPILLASDLPHLAMLHVIWG